MTEPKTTLKTIGGNNDDRIGGNCSVLEHTNEFGETKRIVFDLGVKFMPYESGFVAAFPDMSRYFDHVDPQTGVKTTAEKPVDALFITHAHEDHIGALTNYVKMGYQLPAIYTGKYTRNLIRLSFKSEGLPIPEINEVKAGEDVRVGQDVIIEPFTVSHSILDSMGFHTLTFANGEPFAAFVNNGDFLTDEKMPVGESFNQKDYLSVLKRKKAPRTFMEIDSTSTSPDGAERIGFEKAVENTMKVIEENKDRSVLISPVIARSIQNIAIDMEAARRLNTKIFLDGKFLQLVKDAMALSGYHDFDDVIYKGSMQGYLNSDSIAKKYIVCTGAFAQGMDEYENNRWISDTAPLPIASATKMALDIHPWLKINQDVLVLSRQRIIDDINGVTGPKMLQKMAAQGAKVVMSPCGRNIGGFQQVRMQDSGHINAHDLKMLMQNVKKMAPKLTVIPIHGNPEQFENTKQIMDELKISTTVMENNQSLEVRADGFSVTKADEPAHWFATKLILPSLYDERDIPADGIKEFWKISENGEPLEKVCEVENTRKIIPSSKGLKITKNDQLSKMIVTSKRSHKR